MHPCGKFLTIAGLAISAIVAIGCAEPRTPIIPPPSPVEVLDLDGNIARPLEVAPNRPMVIVFMRTDCPIGNRYAPTLARLAGEFRPQGVDFALVYPHGGESRDDIQQHLREYSLEFTAYRDPDRQLVSHAKATVTPETAVFDTDRQLVYRGRIDDRYVDFGKARAKPTTEDLRNVLTAIGTGQTVEPTTTQAVGCYIE